MSHRRRDHHHHHHHHHHQQQQQQQQQQHRSSDPQATMDPLELARMRAWHRERPAQATGPPGISAAALSERLRAQAQEHGLSSYEVDGRSADDLFEREQLAKDEREQRTKGELQSFAGLRPEAGAGGGGMGCVAEAADAAAPVPNTAVIGLLTTNPDAIRSADQLESAGLQLLQQELTRLGLKCGGSLGERAERLFQTKGLPRDQWPRKILAKRKRSAAEAPPAMGNKRVIGPRGPARPRSPTQRVAAPRGQGAGAREAVGIWRPNV
jgi:hypothetical protein